MNKGEHSEDRGKRKPASTDRRASDRRDSDKPEGKNNKREDRYTGRRDEKRSFGSGPKSGNFRRDRSENDGDRRKPSGDFKRDRKEYDSDRKRSSGDFKRDRSGHSGDRRKSNSDFRRNRNEGEGEERSSSREFRRDKPDFKSNRRDKGDSDRRKSSGNFRRDKSDQDGKERKPYSRDDRGFKGKKEAFSGPKKNFKKSAPREDHESEGREKKRPRTRKFMEKDQELLGDWRKERPATSFDKSEDRGRREVATITEETRLNKFLANSGLCSRRDADSHIENGAVTINGVVAKELGTRVQPGDEVRFKGRLILPEKPVYILMNKPKDCITSSDDPEGRRTVLDIIGDHIPQRIFPVGRLDRNTTGVLLLTNDGDLAQKLTHPSYGVHKIYRAELDKVMGKEDFEKLEAGVELEDGFVKPDELAYVDETRKVLGIEIHSGKNHIVHRMFNSLGYKVDKLDRVSFAGLSKDGLKRGDIRHLSEKELMTLRKESGKKPKA